MAKWVMRYLISLAVALCCVSNLQANMPVIEYYHNGISEEVTYQCEANESLTQQHAQFSLPIKFSAVTGQHGVRQYGATVWDFSYQLQLDLTLLPEIRSTLTALLAPESAVLVAGSVSTELRMAPSDIRAQYAAVFDPAPLPSRANETTLLSASGATDLFQGIDEQMALTAPQQVSLILSITPAEARTGAEGGTEAGSFEWSLDCEWQPPADAITLASQMPFAQTMAHVATDAAIFLGNNTAIGLDVYSIELADSGTNGSGVNTFEILPYSNNCTNMLTIKGYSCRVPIQYTPDSPGQHTTDLIVHSNMGRFQFELSATSTEFIAPNFRLSPNPLQFDAVPLSAIQSQTVTLENLGPTPIVISHSATTAIYTEIISISDDCRRLNSGASCTLPVYFRAFQSSLNFSAEQVVFSAGYPDMTATAPATEQILTVTGSVLPPCVETTENFDVIGSIELNRNNEQINLNGMLQQTRRCPEGHFETQLTLLPTTVALPLFSWLPGLYQTRVEANFESLPLDSAQAPALESSPDEDAAADWTFNVNVPHVYFDLFGLKINLSRDADCASLTPMQLQLPQALPTAAATDGSEWLGTANIGQFGPCDGTQFTLDSRISGNERPLKLTLFRQ